MSFRGFRNKDSLGANKIKFKKFIYKTLNILKRFRGYGLP